MYKMDSNNLGSLMHLNQDTLCRQAFTAAQVIFLNHHVDFLL